jgi:hypothetical protein
MDAQPNERPSVVIGGGWMGQLGQLKHVLRVMGADTDEAGNFLVDGTIATMLGLSGDADDVVVGADAVYVRNGQRCGLAVALNGTSYGLRGVTVI